MAENYINVQLTINGYNTCYQELKGYMETYKPAYASKLSAKNLGFEDGKRPFPVILHLVSKI